MSKTAFRVLRCSMLSLSFFLLASCGDGESGDGGLRISLERSSIVMEHESGAEPKPAKVKVRVSGRTDEPLYIGASVEGDGIDPSVPIAMTGDEAELSIYPMRAREVGEYSGRVVIHICSDPRCQQQTNAVMKMLSYKIKFARTLIVMPDQLRLEASSGEEVSAELSIEAPFDMAETAVVDMLNRAPWLQVGQVENGRLTVVGRPWKAGQYSDIMRVRTRWHQRLIPVTYTVLDENQGGGQGPQHDLQLSPQSLEFMATENATSPAKEIHITRPSWGSASIRTAVDYHQGVSDWLDVTQSGDILLVTASAGGLSKGSYSATLNVIPDVPGSPVQVHVAFTVREGFVRPADQVIAVSAETVQAELVRQVPINMADGMAVNWRAVSDADWLVLTRSSGSTGSSLGFRPDLGRLQSMANFSELEATITVNADVAHVSPTRFQVVLQKKLPAASYAGPYTVITGRPTRLFIRGRGFDAISSLSQRLQLNGLEATQVHRVSDTQIVAEVLATKAGDHEVYITNALGQRTGTAKVKVLEPQTYELAVVATAQRKSNLIFDHARRALYVLGEGVDGPWNDFQLYRFQYRGGEAWRSDVMSLPGIRGIGLGPEDRDIVALSAVTGSDTRGSRISGLDPDSLQTRFEYFYPWYSDRQNTRLMTTNDGKTWGDGYDLIYFDHLDHGVHLGYPKGQGFGFYQGFRSAISRDGSRIVISPVDYSSAGAPLYYLDALDGVLKPTSAVGSRDARHVHLSENGKRLLLVDILNAQIRDENFGLIGRIDFPLEDETGLRGFPVAWALSPDGSRVYVHMRGGYISAEASYKIEDIHVFDSSAAQADTLALPLLGVFALPASPGCNTSLDGNSSCYSQPKMTISPDGRTLFSVDNENLVVMPVPDGLRELSAGGGLVAARQRADKRAQSPLMHRWPAQSRSR